MIQKLQKISHNIKNEGDEDPKNDIIICNGDGEEKEIKFNDGINNKFLENYNLDSIDFNSNISNNNYGQKQNMKNKF